MKAGLRQNGDGDVGNDGQLDQPRRGSAGLKPERNIAGFSIRTPDGTNIPLIFEAAVGKARDTVILKLSGPVPRDASLWYGHGLSTYCNLIDGLDMAVPVFGPIEIGEPVSARSASTAAPTAAPTNAAAQADAGIRVKAC